LDYTLERTSAAESECEGLLALVVEIKEGGAAGSKAQEMTAQNDTLRESAQACGVEVSTHAQAVSSHANALLEQLKTVRAEMRKAESAAQAAAAAEKARVKEAALAAGEEVPPDDVATPRDSPRNFSSSYHGGGGGGGGNNEALMASVAALTAKVTLMESQHGDQLRALVSKTKELHKVVKYQQEQLAAFSSASSSSSPPPVLADDIVIKEVGSSLPPPIKVDRNVPTNEENEFPPIPAPATNNEYAPASPGDEASSKETNMEDMANKLLSEAMREVNQEGAGSSSSNMVPEEYAHEEHARMLEREALLSDRVEKQAAQLASLQASSEERVMAAEAKVSSLEASLEALQAKVDKMFGSTSEAPNMRAQAMQHRNNNQHQGQPQTSTASPTSGGGGGPGSKSKTSSSGGGTRGRSPFRTTPQTKAMAAAASSFIAGATGGAVGGGVGESLSGGVGGEQGSSRLSLWANIRDRMFGGTATRARMLNLTIIEATFHDTSRNQKLPLDAFIEIRNITTGQVEATKVVKKSYKPKYNEHFVFKTKQNANDMIMMKIMENMPSGAGATIFGSVALPLDSKHTQGVQIPMPIFDEGLNMKGVVRVAAIWSTSYPRRLKMALQGVQDVPEAMAPPGTFAACRFVSTISGQAQASEKVAISAGCCDLKGRMLEGLEMSDENDRLAVELLLFQDENPNNPGVIFGRAEVTLPGDGPGVDEAIVVTQLEGGGERAVVFLRTTWAE
jgi:hypothetical protein